MKRHTSSRSSVPPGRIRIIGGQWKRTPIPVVETSGLRPTPDRVRETLFNWLTHLFDGSLSGLAVLDLFAGTGALGFEAASRGAEPVVLVERGPDVVAGLVALKTKLGAPGVEIVPGDAQRVIDALVRAGRRFDIVFLDPPFHQRLLGTILPYVPSLCTPSAVVYAESEAPADPALLALSGLELLRSDRAGDVFYYLLRCKTI